MFGKLDRSHCCCFDVCFSLYCTQLIYLLFTLHNSHGILYIIADNLSYIIYNMFHIIQAVCISLLGISSFTNSLLLSTFPVYKYKPVCIILLSSDRHINNSGLL